MNHNVKIGKSEGIIVELPDVLPDGQAFEARVGGRPVTVRWHRASGNLQILEGGVERNCNLRSRSAVAFDSDPTTTVNAELVAGSAKGLQCVEAQVTPHVPGQEQRRAAHGAQGLVVRSQITGKVLKVLVKTGDRVEAGGALFIIEAMKMENRVFASAGGVVQSVGVKEGDQVAAGKELVRLSP
jgi:biotin carboxyl carrier protein